MAEQSEHTHSALSAGEAVARLNSALERIAFAIERRKAMAATVVAAPTAPAGPDVQMIAANLDALIMRVRDVLEETAEPGPAPVGEEPSYGDDDGSSSLSGIAAPGDAAGSSHMAPDHVAPGMDYAADHASGQHFQDQHFHDQQFSNSGSQGFSGFDHRAPTGLEE
ncbi:hypothetical protein AA23498_1258 [Acetobacter nitrogenifigens DSM 23921 = NBRC 105050]|uniref:Uncharacterized protein n=1 Tax=Acetobacter nitrogenifigens DSM 23921 = NBRC 105050 TaxID=1120919 RepID=A0A511XD34_9PROT|nr:hypothetical protein [Acetobacter nitrogenifigens]GBQ91715.1 hypothetical protein AA23498_1258 [Acetobacter nitrogenifigens DSM 23921 = NBRC 105050]GEN60791.1 hypothetical protein ANI02nite_26750 [Acetobacter nitrogenifigens DSM 23921 = NBRC 105050]